MDSEDPEEGPPPFLGDHLLPDTTTRPSGNLARPAAAPRVNNLRSEDKATAVRTRSSQQAGLPSGQARRREGAAVRPRRAGSSPGRSRSSPRNVPGTRAAGR